MTTQPIPSPDSRVREFDLMSIAKAVILDNPDTAAAAELDRHMTAERLRHRALVAELSGERHLSVVRDEVVEG